MAGVQATSTPRFNKARLAQAMGCVALLAASVLPVTPLWAQTASPVPEPRRQFVVPPGTLDQVLSRLGRQSGAQIAVDARLTVGIDSPGLTGEHTVAEALRAVLVGTGLEVVRDPAGEYSLRRRSTSEGAPAARATGSLPSVTVTAGADFPGEPPRPYAGGQVGRGQRLGLLGDKDFLDTPFNTTSFTAKTLQDQQARTIGDVVKNDPSVRTIWPDGSYINQFTIRGFPTQTQDMAINGLYGIVPPQMTGGLEAVERVEVLKGPSALLNGMAPTGAVGGNINLVTKRATDAPVTQLTTSYFSDAQYGAHVDLGRRFGEDNRWGVRFNGAYRDGRTGVDDQSQRAGSATLKLDFRGERLRLSADLGYHDIHTDAPTRVVFTDNANFQIPRAPKNTLSLGQPWYFAASKDSFGMVQGEFDITSELTAYAAFGGRKNDFLGLYNFIYLQNALGDFRANQYFQPTFSDTRTAQAGLRAKLVTGSVHHDLNLSVDTLHTDSGVLAPVVSTYRSNMYFPSYVAPPNLLSYSSVAPRTAESELTSVALADTLHFLNDRVQLTLGLRQQKVKAFNFSTAGTLTSSYDRERTSPAVGLVVRPWANTSFYANYIEGLSQGPAAPAGTANAGTVFAPIQAKQLEVGVKYDFGDFATSASLFQIRQPTGFVNTATNQYAMDGEQRNRGLEFNVFGEPWRGLRLLGGVTFMDGELTRTANGSYDGNKAIGVPTTQFNLGAEWDVPQLPGLTLTGRFIYTSSQSYNVANSQRIPAWNRVDIGARYGLRAGGQPVTLRAGIENLLDRDYWAAASSSFGLARGAPRTLALSATFDF
jgi:iron complex outermembrane recepter protein